MKTHTTPRLTALAAALLLAGCASPLPRDDTAGRPAQAAIADPCERLAADIAGATEAHRAALDRQENAWQALVPLVVAHRYASGKSAAAQAAERQDALRDEAARLGCDSKGG